MSISWGLRRAGVDSSMKLMEIFRKLPYFPTGAPSPATKTFVFVTLAGPNRFLHPPRPRGGGGYNSLAVSLLMELERRGRNERIERDERKIMVPKFKVLGQPVTSEVRSMTSEVM